MKFAKRSFLVALIVFLTSVVVWGIFSPLSQPRIPYNHRRAIHNISDLSLAQRIYSARHSYAGYACKLNDLGALGLVDGVLASGTKSGYHFEIQCPQRGAQKAESFTITAVPTIPGVTGQYALCADQSGEVWYGEDGLVSDCLAMHKLVGREYR